MSVWHEQQDPGGDPAGLSRMHDLVVPDAPAVWWPLAPGWWALLGALVAVLLLYVVRRWLLWRRDAYRRAALRDLDATPDAELPALVKRAALAAWPREQVASLSGEAWLRFLDRSGGKSVFAGGSGRGLLELAWRPGTAADPALRDAVRGWLRGHRRSVQPVEERC